MSVAPAEVERPEAAQEVVLEEYAPTALFPALERSVFAPVRRSLTVAGQNVVAL